MPWFFQFSKNGRRFLHLPAKERKKYLKPNLSTMNRICSRFDNIGNINMNYANVAPFNWQMLIASNEPQYHASAVSLFCAMDDAGMTNVIESMQPNDDPDATPAGAYAIVARAITEELVSRFGSLQAVYPSIVKYLFAGANAAKISHKQMFWRVFGFLACDALKKNIKTYTVCEKCGMKIPSWSPHHVCPKNAVGFFECCDCGAWCERTNSKQCRCAVCQQQFSRLQNNLRNKRKYVHVKHQHAA